MRTCRATARAIKLTEDPITRMLPALSVEHVAGDMPQRPLGRRYAMTWRALFLELGGNAAAPAVRLRGLFLPPAARAGPSRPLCGLARSEENTYELQSLMRLSHAVFFMNKKTQNTQTQ